MYLFYIFALIPLFIGCGLWLFNHNITWWEWLGGSFISFVIAGVMHFAAIKGQTADQETWSGQITQAREFSKWKEYYEYAVYRTEYYTDTETYTDSKGNTQTNVVIRSREVFDHWEPTSRWHNVYWQCYSNIDTSYDISEQDFIRFCKLFNDKTSIKGTRTTSAHNSRMLDGDPDDYIANNKTGWIQPVTKSVNFENRIKAAPSVFSFIPVGPDIPVFNYPTNLNPFTSDRVLGSAVKSISILNWDQLNAKLGTTKKVNLIIVGFGSKEGMIAQYQQAKWIGGKKNDLVLCYGDNWSRVFGWTDSELVKKNLETILLGNKVDNTIIPLIEQEVIKNYKIKDWKIFDVIAIEPRAAHFLVFFIIMIVTQCLFYWWACVNTEDKLCKKYWSR